MTSVKTPLNGVTATTESEAVSIEGAKKITLLLTRANHTAGSSTFSVKVSIDGITYVDYNKLIDNVSNTNTQNLTRVTSKVLNDNGSAILSMDLINDCFKFMKVKVTQVTDGTHTAKVLIET